MSIFCIIMAMIIVIGLTVTIWSIYHAKEVPPHIDIDGDIDLGDYDIKNSKQSTEKSE